MIYGFYDTYYGHNIEDLETLTNYFRELKKDSNHSTIFLAGDSSLDNKHWFAQTSKSLNGYETILDPPDSKKDVCYWVNKGLVERSLGSKMTCINAAVEESSIGSRACGTLQTHDRFIQTHIRSEDILVVSVGGNDIALKPNCCTIFNAALLLYTQNAKSIERACGQPLSCDDYCCGCCCGCYSNCLSCPCGYGYFLHLFQTRAKAYISNLVSKTKPKKVLICMIYYVDEKETGSWADASMAALGYNKRPEDLQMLTRMVYVNGTRSIKIDGVETIAVPFFTVMDGQSSSDYCERVEPSSQGGSKLSKIILDAVEYGQSKMDEYYNDHCQKLKRQTSGEEKVISNNPIERN